MKDNRSVIIARNFFKRLGFQTSTSRNPSANGTDLHIRKNNKYFSVEVKSAFYSSRSWRVNKTLRVHDDYIAIVFPNGEIHIESMKDHLMKCNSVGNRAVSNLAAIYNSNGVNK